MTPFIIIPVKELMGFLGAVSDPVSAERPWKVGAEGRPCPVWGLKSSSEVGGVEQLGGSVG